MSWFRRKPVARYEAEPREPERMRVTLHVNDDPWERAEKIWRAIGMVNDPTGMVPSMARFLAWYRDADRRFPEGAPTPTEDTSPGMRETDDNKNG